MELLDRAGARCGGSCARGCRCSDRSRPAQPILAEENVEEYIETPPACGGTAVSILLRVRGESMKNVGILDGDLVVVAAGDRADGEIIVALVEDEATVKRFFGRPTTSGCSRRTRRWSRSGS